MSIEIVGKTQEVNKLLGIDDHDVVNNIKE